MSKLIFIVGLPGSGKSEYIKNLNKNKKFVEFDDFKGESLLDNNEFTFSRNYCNLVDQLKSGRDCVVSDIDFCKTSSRKEAELVITGWDMGVEIEWVFFENDPSQCVINVQKRSTDLERNEDRAIQKIEEYTSEFIIPEASKTINVKKKLMNIKLYIEEDKRIKLSLFDGKMEKDCLEWKDENSLSQLLLANSDKLLRKNGVGLDKIASCHIISKVPQKWTTYRIADITLKTLKIGSLAKKKQVC